MYLLDTNIYQFIIDDLHGVNESIKTIPYQDIYLSGLVLYEVIINGWLRELEHIETRKSNSRREDVYEALIQEMDYLSSFQILPYSDQAEARYREIHKTVKANRTDCKIAAHAIVTGKILVTDNTADFERIRQSAPELRFVNWANRPV